MVRTLDELLARIVVREDRFQQCLRLRLSLVVLDQEREVLDSLINEYLSRVNRLNNYMGIN